ncbi:Oligosaccharide translocation protein rft1 [Irineochytrium annulatum]|nr:Oligosaccharide translocation protein rft1 [Irineochytrium annulatum]
MSDPLAISIRGTLQLIVLQLWTRMATVILNQVALRYITRNVLGVVSIDMEFLLSLITFLSRESIRMALLRSTGDDVATVVQGKRGNADANARERHQRLVNLSYLSIVIGAGISAVIGVYYAVLNHGSFKEVAAVYCVAAFIELCTEPFYVLASVNMMFNWRVRIEGVAVLVKCFSVVAFLSLMQTWNTQVTEFGGAMSYALSQLAFSITLVGGYLYYFSTGYRPSWNRGSVVSILLPKAVRGQWFDPVQSSLAWTFTFQSSVKYVLTEGDKILSVSMITAEIKGDYALAERYGSLIARILFQPLEESGRLYFAKAVGTVDDQFKNNIITATNVLTMQIRLHILLGFYFIFLGTNYTGLLVHVLAGHDFSVGTAPLVLAFYCCYVPLMGVNGITEAYLLALGSKQVLTNQSYWMGVCWVVFVSMGYVTIKLLALGAVGLVVSNCVNLTMRIAFAWRFIRDHLLNYCVPECGRRDTEGHIELLRDINRRLTMSSLFPRSVLMWAGFIAIWGVTRYSESVFVDPSEGWASNRAKLMHLGVGVVCGMFAVGLT